MFDDGIWVIIAENVCLEADIYVHEKYILIFINLIIISSL